MHKAAAYSKSNLRVYFFVWVNRLIDKARGYQVLLLIGFTGRLPCYLLEVPLSGWHFGPWRWIFLRWSRTHSQTGTGVKCSQMSHRSPDEGRQRWRALIKDCRCSPGKNINHVHHLRSGLLHANISLFSHSQKLDVWMMRGGKRTRDHYLWLNAFCVMKNWNADFRGWGID